ncbi:Dual specificity serine/threonine tyrosine kinase [Fasciola hepatica]|uniref:Dual specificity serine/threonine tyrosine kinase n=1 Tax=Fasciola hepatica TaxID=6192 RepID=A0A4E0RIB7_FASHE|nr:Dual specificity serine/threonine tyrosine kinase [Fasciola hepatica]
MLTDLEDISLDLQKAILKECPIDSRSHKEWLTYLDKVEQKLRQSNLTEHANRIMLKLYEDACSCLSEKWDEEAYVIMFIRRIILALHEQSSTGLFLLSLCSFNTRRNPRAAITVAFLYDIVGQKKRAQNLLTNAKKFADHQGLRQLNAAYDLLAQDGNLKPLMGNFYYEPPKQNELQFLDISLNQSCTDTTFKKPFTSHQKADMLFPPTLPIRSAQDRFPPTLSGSLSGSVCHSSRTDVISRSTSYDFTEVTPDLRRYSTPPLVECSLPYLNLLSSNQLEKSKNFSSIPHLGSTSKSTIDISKSTEDAPTISTQEKDFLITVSASGDASHLTRASIDIMNPTSSFHAVPHGSVSTPARTSAELGKELQSRLPPLPPGIARIPLQPLDPDRWKPTSMAKPESVLPMQSLVSDENRYETTSKTDLPSVEDVCPKTVDPPKLSPEPSRSPSIPNTVTDIPERIEINLQTYWILRELGRGGSSVVYSALDSKRCIWAIKCVELDRVDKQLMAGFANEIAMLRSLGDTDRVIRLHDCELKADRILLVLEHADTDLKDLFLRLMKLDSTENPNPDSDPCVPLPAVVFYWDQMLRCVKALHDRRIVHLDLKPQNFVLVHGVLKLIDLGISQRLPDDCTRINPTVPLGTLTFMSPEQLSGSEPSTAQPGSRLWSPEAANETRLTLGRKSDIWSIGVMLYMMVYGRAPFAQTTVHSRMLAIINPNLPIDFPLIANQGLFKALRRSLVRDFHERASVDELLSFTYV